MAPLDISGSAASAAGFALANDLAALTGCGFPELRSRFRKLYKTPAPPAFSKELVARLVAQRLQELAHGKLDRNLAGLLDRHARGAKGQRHIKTGSLLVREHDGVMHEVVIIPGGFLWNGESHRSLSTIAKRITGTDWNGPRFFGLRAGAKRQSGGSARHA